MVKKNADIIFCLLPVIFISACADLKQVNSYSTSSVEAIKKYEDIHYDFKQFCLDRCLFESVKNRDIKRELACDCTLYKSADSVTMIIYTAVKGYFDGLSHLSDNDLTSYKLDELAKTLKEGDFGEVKIGKEEVDAYKNISKILLRAITDAYRKKKLRQYISEGNQPIQVLLAKFQFIIQTNLGGELDFRKESLFAYYKELSLSNKNSDYEKGKLTMDYYTQLSAVNEKQQQIDVYAKAIHRIADGHQKLFENGDSLNAEQVTTLIRQYASDIEDIIAAFNKIKK